MMIFWGWFIFMFFVIPILSVLNSTFNEVDYDELSAKWEKEIDLEVMREIELEDSMLN